VMVPGMIPGMPSRAGTLKCFIVSFYLGFSSSIINILHSNVK
jgi:hypothetical protein